MKLKFTLVFILASLCSLSDFAQKNVSIVMQHGDHRGAGLNDRETLLNTSNVNTNSFGKLFSLPVDDQLYAQPLVVAGISIGGIKRNVVYAATANNSVYAYDADSVNGGKYLWKRNYTPGGQRPPTNFDMRGLGACGGGYNDFSRQDGTAANMGIVGTPVIDTLSQTMYFVARNTNGNSFQQFFHAIDITTGAERSGSPVLIQASIAGTGSGSSNGTLTFDPAKQNQRTGLVLSQNIVYITYASHCDNGPYHGWVFGYDAGTLAQKIIYNTTPDGYNGGIWMSGAAPSVDEIGNLYVAVGNGSVATDGSPRNRSESLVKLTPNLATGTLDQKSFFTPVNYQQLEATDLDFGVTEVLLIPNTSQAFVGVKDGNLYLTNRDNMGGFGTTNNVTQTIQLGSGKTLRSSFSYFKGSAKEFVYSWSENAALRAYPYNRSTGRLDNANAISSGIQGPTSANNGVFMSVSSNGSKDGTGILWASHASNGDANQSVRPGILRAIDANDVTKELWNSNKSPNDNLSNYAKFVCPVIANGKVYMATFSNQLMVYGVKDTAVVPTCGGSTDLALGKTAVASSSENGSNIPSNAFDGNAVTRWASTQGIDSSWIYVDLGARFNICQVNLTWEVALAKNFQIQVSDDAAKWTTIKSVTGNTALVNSISANGTGRYVRMLGTIRGTTYGYSLYSFEIFGTPANACETPAGLAVSNISKNGATLSWNASAGVSSFNLQYKTVSAPTYTAVTVNANTFNLSSLACGTDYLFKVQAVCSGSSQSIFSLDKSFSSGVCDSSCGILPTRWSQQDIGAVGFSGQVCYNNEVWNMQASGTDIWNNSDQFHYVYKTFSNDGQVTARIDSLDQVNVWNKAGVMFRESNDPGARQAFMAFTSGNGMAFQYRQVAGGPSYSSQLGGFSLPYYVKLIKRGSTFSGYVSQDSLTWKQIGSTVDLGFGVNSTCNAGLAATAHDNGKVSSSAFSHVPIVLSADTSVNTGQTTDCPTINLALNRPAASSGNLSTDKSIYEFQAFDGDLSTRWAGAQGSDNGWLYVDLGKRYSLCQVAINWSAEYGKNYQIQVSDDAITWNTIYTVNNNTSLTNTLSVAGTGRFVRMLGTLRGTALGYSISDMSVTGTIIPGQSPNLALNRPVNSSSNENNILIPSAAFDGIGSTRWASAPGVDPSSVYVDLGSVKSISTVVLDWETALGKDFQIQVSNDATNWSTVNTVTGNTQYSNVLSVNTTGRYVRMYGTQRGYPAGYSLYEMEVYGTTTELLQDAAVKDIGLVSLFPNPATNTITVASDRSPVTQVDIEDINGLPVRSTQVNSLMTVTLDITTLYHGIYFVVIHTHEGNVVKKLMKVE